MSDVLTHFAGGLEQARAQAAAWIGRAEALHALLGFAQAAAGELDQVELTPEQLWAACADEHQRAQLAAWLERALPHRDLDNTAQEESFHAAA